MKAFMPDTNVTEGAIQGLFFEDISVGMEAEISNIITDENILLFASISGDTNPVHLDQSYAADTPFKARIAHGSMCASYILALLGTRLPGPGCIYVNQNLRFKAPVYIGDEMVTRVVVSNRVVEKNFIELITRCFVGHVLVLDGEATLKLPNSAESNSI